jgi:hypothetical protein
VNGTWFAETNANFDRMREQSEVARFLRSHPGYLCDDCLAARLAIPPRQVSMTTLGLRQVQGFEIAEDVCSLCARRRRVIRAPLT